MSIRGSATHQKVQRYKYSKNNHFRRKNKDLLKNFSKLERASQSTDGVNPLRRWPMIGLLIPPIWMFRQKACCRKATWPTSFACAPAPCTKRAWRLGRKAEPMTMFTTIQSAATPTIRRSALLLIARLRCFLNGWVAAAIAYREQAAAPRSCVKLRSIRNPLQAVQQPGE